MSSYRLLAENPYIKTVSLAFESRELLLFSFLTEDGTAASSRQLIANNLDPRRQMLSRALPYTPLVVLFKKFCSWNVFLLLSSTVGLIATVLFIVLWLH